jgi:hypothetical protein
MKHLVFALGISEPRPGKLESPESRGSPRLRGDTSAAVSASEVL